MNSYWKFEEIPSEQTFVKCETYYFDKVENKVLPRKNKMFLNIQAIETVDEQEDGLYSVSTRNDRWTLRFCV